MDSQIKPFKIDIPDAKLERLKVKLDLATFPEELPMSDNWEYGVPVSDIKRLTKYWRNGFDWRLQEARLNEIPQFTTNIDVDGFGELDIHFLHQKSKSPGSVPLLFCHGWPGNFLEAIKLLPLLMELKDGLSFDVVIPSLPNFGFSEAAKKPGFALHQYAECLHKLMIKLGYNTYATLAGNWGTSITRFIGIKYPTHCLASHFTFVWAEPPKLFEHPWLYLQNLLPYTAREKSGLASSQQFFKTGYSYGNLHSTHPATIGVALADSPVGLLAWIYEKLHSWTDGYPWTDDEILTWISIYLFSRGGPEASVRIYWELRHPQLTEHVKYNPGVKLGFSYFPKDLVLNPKIYGRTLGPVVFEVEHESGGHFAAHEMPEVLAEDLRKMFGKGGGAYDITKKCGGA